MMVSAYAPTVPSRTIAEVMTAKEVMKPTNAVVKEWELGAMSMG
jgi:hypothetical protein